MRSFSARVAQGKAVNAMSAISARSRIEKDIGRHQF
jgi:hypothetical protein